MNDYNSKTNIYSNLLFSFHLASAKFTETISEWTSSIEQNLLLPLSRKIINLVKQEPPIFHTPFHSPSTLSQKTKNKVFPAKNLMSEVLHDYRKNQSNNHYKPKLRFAHFNKENSLDSNLELAAEILEETRKAVPFSCNNMSRNRQLIDKYAVKYGIDLKDLSPIVKEASLRVKNNRTSNESKCDGDQFKRAMLYNKTSKSHLIGNCSEMTDVAVFKAMKKGAWNILLERGSIRYGDHVFMIIGRKEGSDAGNYKTWGPHAVIVDTWAGKYFKASDIEEELYDYVGVNDVTGKANLKLFNPKTQQIRIDFESICSVAKLIKFKEIWGLKESQIESFDKVIEQLQKFHQSNELQTKQDAAAALSKLCHNPSIRFIPEIATLKNRVDYFLKLSEKVEPRTLFSKICAIFKNLFCN